MVRLYVPVQLHNEISEYASLLRALHTSSALDVTAHLTGPSRTTTRDRDEEGHLDGRTHPRVSATTDGATSKKQATTQKLPSIDTRWPLLLVDVPAPTWSFEDELRVLATRVLRSGRPSRTHQNDVEGEGDDDEDDDPVDLILPFLTQACTNHLTHILDLLSVHVPISEKSMQGRITPLTWESVLDIVSVADACDVRSIESVQRRLEAVYGPAEKRVVPNIDFRGLDKQTFERACLPEEMDFLTFPPQPEKDDE